MKLLVRSLLLLALLCDVASANFAHRGSALQLPRGGAKAPVRPPVRGKKQAAEVSAITTEGASIPNEIFNLVKSIVGAGVLGLPAGKSPMCFVERRNDDVSSFSPAEG